MSTVGAGGGPLLVGPFDRESGIVLGVYRKNFWRPSVGGQRLFKHMAHDLIFDSNHEFCRCDRITIYHATSCYI